MNQTMLRAGVCAIALGTASEGLSADVTVFTDQFAFDAATNAPIVVTFEEVEWEKALSTNFYGAIGSGGILFVPIESPPITAPNLYVAPPRQTNFCCPLLSRTLTSSGGEDIDLAFSSPPRAVGFMIYANGGEPIVYTFTFAGSPPLAITSPQTPNTLGFIGFVSSEPIVKLNWTSDFGDIVNAGMDDVRTGTVSCPPDLNGDTVVDASDLAILLGAWSTSTADLDGNGNVDAADLAILLGAWGPC